MHDWQKAEVWQELHRVLLHKICGADKLDSSRVVADSSSVHAVHGGKTGPNPTDRRKAGSKHHLLVDAQGIPVNAVLTEANRHDVTQLLPLVERVQPIRGKRGQPLKKHRSVQADRAHESRAIAWR